MIAMHIQIHSCKVQSKDPEKPAEFVYVCIIQYKDGSQSMDVFDYDVPLASMVHNAIIDCVAG